MAQDIIEKFISLAKSKEKNKARILFLEESKRNYSMLLLKSYLTHMVKSPNEFQETKRIAILGSSNVSALKDMLKALFHAQSINTEYYIGGYGNYIQEIMAETSDLYKFKPEITVIILSIRDILSSIYEQPFSYDPKAIDQMLADLGVNVKSALNQYIKLQPSSSIYLCIVPSFEEPISYVYSSGFSYKSDYYFLKLMEYISELERDNENIYLLDSCKLIHKYPVKKIEDNRYWHLGKIRYSDEFFFEIAKEITYIHNMVKQPSKKCLVLDLDNILWGGVIGQDGIENIILGQDGLGKAFQDFQKEILKIHKKGIILAICSKNNSKDAQEVFKTHNSMILKNEHFVSKRINWQDKATNIKEIAQEINIGLDSIVFLDDDPVEKAWVRQNLPQVTVPDLPNDQFLYPDFLKNSEWFNSYRLSHEDITRNSTYHAISKSKALKQSSQDLWSYLKRLNQTVELEKVSSSTISRTVQLCQKTNQFNLTTKRYQIQDIQSFMKNDTYLVYTIKVTDCFCDYGIVGVLILEKSPQKGTILIDAFLLSCRVIGRRIEFAILDWLKSDFKKKRYKFIEANYIRTEKNIVCADVYENNFFKCFPGVEGSLKYRFDLDKKIKLSPYNKYIKIKIIN